MLRSILVLTLAASLLTACTRPEASLDQQLDELLRVLPGNYAGEASIEISPTGETQDIFHKLAPIDAPQFGERVLYYQLSSGSADGPALQMKIFVFDLDPERLANRMRAYVFAPGQAAGNLDQDPDRWAALDPATLMSFPDECAFTWSPVSGGFAGVVRASDCAFAGQSFKQTIRPEMSYRILGDRFEWDEILYGDDLRIIVTTNGPLPAFRE